MYYTIDIENSIKKFQDNISNRNSDISNVSYKDAKDLKEIISIVYNIISNEDLSKDELIKSLDYLYYLGNIYDNMKRLGTVVQIYSKALKCIVELYKNHNELYSNHGIIIQRLIHSKKRYHNVSIQEEFALCRSFLNNQELSKYFYTDISEIIYYKNDPVELTQKYIDVIDEVEEKIDIELDKMSQEHYLCSQGINHFYISFKVSILKEYGIYWSSPKEISPLRRF